MNYSKIYDQLVAKAKPRGLNKNSVDFYTEIHHIVPRSIGGTDESSNLVMFSGREHFVAHMLLWKSYPEDISLMRAAFMMSSRWKTRDIPDEHPQNSRTYSRLREEYAQAVSIQCSGENNPMFGVTHSAELREQIEKTRKKTNRRKQLADWRNSNEKYMSQFKPKQTELQPFLINIGSSFPTFRYKGELKDWLAFEVYKDFWSRSGKTGKKDLSTKIVKVSGKEFSTSYFTTMTGRFVEDFDPSSNSDYVAKALNNNSDEYITEMEYALRKTLVEIEDDYISDWMDNREDNRSKIQDALTKLKVEKHKYNSKAIFSLVDVTEALILWRSGFVEQKFLANLYGVARNSVSNALETKERWLEVKNKIEEIEVSVFDNYKRSSACQQTTSDVFVHP